MAMKAQGIPSLQKAKGLKQDYTLYLSMQFAAEAGCEFV